MRPVSPKPPSSPAPARFRRHSARSYCYILHSTGPVAVWLAAQAGDSAHALPDPWKARRARGCCRILVPAKRSTLQQKHWGHSAKDPGKTGRLGIAKNQSCQSRCFVVAESSRRRTVRQAAASWATHQARLVFCWRDCAASSVTAAAAVAAAASDAGPGGYRVEVGMRFGQGVRIRASGGRCSKESRRKMAKSQRVYGQCSLAQAALSVWSRLGWNWQAGHALAVLEDSSTRSQCHGGAAGGGGGGSGGCGWVLRWRRWCLFLFRDLLLCGWSWSRYGKKRRRSTSRSVCLKTVLRLTWQADGVQYTVYCLKHTVTTTMLQRRSKQLRERSHSPPAPCAALSTTLQQLTFAPAKPASFLGFG